MVQSEQVPSAVLLDVGLDRQGSITEAGGVLVQRMPGAPEGRIESMQQKLLEFNPISEWLAGGSYIDDIMNRAMESGGVKELDRQAVDLVCRCPRNRSGSDLAMR